MRGGVLQQDIVDILLRNTRLPQSAKGDMNGQINALDLGVRRMDALISEYRADTVSGALEALSDSAERLARAEIAALPDGRWEATDYLDNDGISDTPLTIKVAIEIKGDALTLDFTGSAGPTAGPVNISRGTAIACVYVAIKHIFPLLPANAGVMRPINVIIPEKSLLAAEFPSSTGGYTETILRMIDVMFSGFAQVAPGRVVANAYGTINALLIAGHRGDGRRWVMFSFYGGGHGGTPEGDGLNHGNAPISTATIPPLEILESAYPVIFRQWALRPDSGGAGQHRGGLGAVYEIELMEQKAEAFLFGERGLYPPQGVDGGGEAALNRFTYESAEGWQTPPMVSKMVGIALGRGQRVRLETPGGGGFGPASARDPSCIAQDVRLGYVTAAAADVAYGKARREATQ